MPESGGHESLRESEGVQNVSWGDSALGRDDNQWKLIDLISLSHSAG